MANEDEPVAYEVYIHPVLWDNFKALIERSYPKLQLLRFPESLQETPGNDSWVLTNKDI